MADFQDDSLTPVPIPGEGEEDLRDEATVTLHEGVWRPDPTISTGRAHVIVIRGAEVGSVFALDKDRMVLGRETSADIQITDVGISRRHAALVRRDGAGYELHDLGSRNGTHIQDERLNGPVTLDNNRHFRLGQTTVLKFLEQGDLEAVYAKTMYRAAMTDSLTGAFNRRYLEVRLASEVAFTRRHNTPLALLLIDLDHFKRVNDNHGHVVGDQVLEEFSGLARNSIRAEDMMARYGGEEFAIVVRLKETATAEQLGERIRNTVAAHLFQAETARIRLTISIGVASYDDLSIQSAVDLISSADEALLLAKAQGRNQVKVFGK